MHWRLGLGLKRAGPGRGLPLDISLRSTLTHSIVRRRFLAHTGSDHLGPKEKQALKRLVEEELLKMQVWAEPPSREGLLPRSRGQRRGVAEYHLDTRFALLMHKQMDEAGARKGLDLAKKAKRPPTSCSDPERKRFRLNSDSG